MIYWDHNAGAPLRPEVARVLSRPAANPSSVHRAGREARARLTAARDSVARALGCEPREVVFTGSGSEAAALAIRGTWDARADLSRTRVVTTAIEHPCVLGAVGGLPDVVRVKPAASGRVDAADVIAALTPQTALCSVMWVNNETGVIQPVAEIARACQQRGIPFHTDAVQAVGKLPATLREVPADLLSFSAHKLGGPAGVGVLIARRGLALKALIPGHQEDGRRGGTQAVTAIEGLALALELSVREKREIALRDRFEQGVLGRFPDAVIHGALVERAPGTSNIRFPGADGEALLIALDLEGICVSTGAACASGSLSPSHVLTAMGLTAAQAHSTVRFSFGASVTEGDADAVLAALARHVPKAREA